MHCLHLVSILSLTIFSFCLLTLNLLFAFIASRSRRCCVCVCVCVSELSVLLAHQHPELADLLSRIQFASVAVVNIQYLNDVLPVEVYLKLLLT